MSTTTEREIKVADGLGNADASQVLAGATFSSENGFNQEGTFAPDASNITYNDGTVADALDGLVENGVKNGTELTDILPSGQTTITFTSEEITNDSKLNAVYTSIFDVQLESASFGDGTLTLVFPAQEEDMTVTALINATSTGDDIVAREVMDDLNVHIADTDNPHGVIAKQVGIDNAVSGISASNMQGAIDELKGTIGYSKKNLIPFPYFVTTNPFESNGMTYTYNDSGVMNINGVSTGDTWFNLIHATNKPLLLKKGKYILSGCASGGSNATYRIELLNSNFEVLFSDIGNGCEFTLEEDTNVGLRIYVFSGTTLNNVVFKPMIRYASIEDGTYEPYVPSIGEIVVNDSITATVTATYPTIIKTYSNLPKGKYIMTFRALGTSNTYIIAQIKKNGVELSAGVSSINVTGVSVQVNVNSIFEIQNSTDTIDVIVQSGLELTNRAGQNVRIMRIA